MQELKKDMIANIKCYHKNFSEKYLKDLKIEELMPFTHPSNRDKFQLRFNNLKGL